MVSRPKLLVACKVCKNEFLCWQFRIDHDRAYCSKICGKVGHDSAAKKMWDSRKNNKHWEKLCERKCAFCNKKFTVSKPSSERKFCDHSCYSKSRTGLGRLGGIVKHTCSVCGKKFQTKRSLALKGIRCSHECYVRAQLQTRKPNGQERRLGRLIEQYGFRYVGDGKLSIERKHPDFVHRDGRTLIELFGDHWHTQDEVRPRLRLFARNGYRCLIIWGRELRNPTHVKARVIRFLRNS